MKLKYSGQDIAKIEFSGVEKGYEPLEVDRVLDDIITDYQIIDKLDEELTILKDKLALFQQENSSLKDEINNLKKRIKELEDEKVDKEAEFSFLKSRVEKALGDSRDIDSAIDNLIYIKELENKLVSLGGDPSLIRANMYRKTGTYKKL